jgi:hypothetical protein
MINPLEHRKTLEKVREDAKFIIKKKPKKNTRNSPTICTTASCKHVKFLNDLAVDLTIKHRKVHTMADVMRLVINYAENFKDELSIFYEATMLNKKF